MKRAKESTRELEKKRRESEWWQKETESDARVVELEREKGEVETRLEDVEGQLVKLRQAARVQMEKSREAIERREVRIKELEDMVHEETRSEESSEGTDESEEEEEGIKARLVAVIREGQGERWYEREERERQAEDLRKRERARRLEENKERLRWVRHEGARRKAQNETKAQAARLRFDL